MVTPFSSSGPSRSPSECSFQQAQQQQQQQQQQHQQQQAQQQSQQAQQQQHKQQPNRSNGVKSDGNKEAVAATSKTVGKSVGGGASDRRQQNGHNNPGKQQQQQPPHPSSVFRGQQLQQQRRPQQQPPPPPLLSLMSVGLQNKTSLLGFPTPGGVPIAPQEVRMSLLGNPMPILPVASAAKGLNVKLHPAGVRAVATGDVKANGGVGSVAEGSKGGRSKGVGGGGKSNSGPHVNKSELSGGANSSKFLHAHHFS